MQELNLKLLRLPDKLEALDLLLLFRIIVHCSFIDLEQKTAFYTLILLL